MRYLEYIRLFLLYKPSVSILLCINYSGQHRITFGELKWKRFRKTIARQTSLITE